MVQKKKWGCLLISTVVVFVVLGQFISVLAQEKVTLNVWFWRSFVKEQNAYMANQIKEFEQSKGVKVNVSFIPAEELFRKWMASVEAKTFPDVSEMWISNIIQFEHMGILLDITDVFSEMNAKSLLSPMLSDAVTAEGRKIGLPLHSSAEAHYWRKDILANLGLSVPDTWDQLKDTAKKITEEGSFYGFATALGRPATDGEKFINTVIWSYGGSVADKEGNLVLKSEETLEAVKYIAGLVEEGIMPRGIASWDDGSNNRAYQTKWAAGIQNTASVYNYMRQNDSALLENTAITPIAEGPVGRFSDVSPHAIVANKATRHPEIAKELIKFIMEPVRYQGWIEQAGGQIQPVYPALLDNPFWKDPYKKAFAEMGAKYGVYEGWPGPPTAAAGEIFAGYVLSDMIQKVIVEGWTSEQALEWGFEKAKGIYARWE